MNNMDSILLGDLIEFQRGYDLPKAEMMKGPYPVRSSNGLLGYHNEFKVNGPGITIGRSGTVGIPHLIKENFYPHNTTLFIKDFKGNNVDYIFYLLKHLNLGDRKSGTGVPTMNRNHLHPLKISACKDIVNQTKIAKILSDLDAKIELNNKINSELESMAKLIYDYWFVQFDFPNEDGNPYKSSGGKMIYSEELKREIPDGWTVDIVANLLANESLGGKIASSEYLNKGEIPIIDQSSSFICGYTNDKSKRIVTKVPRIVFGDHTRRLKLINFDFARGADGTQVLLSREAKVPQHFFYHSLLKIDLSNYGYARHFKFLKDSKIIIPDFNTASKFEKKTKLWYNLILANIRQNNMLIELRDWLLPMLMNGQVIVK